jgi:small subunit ribosomal protein S1
MEHKGVQTEQEVESQENQADDAQTKESSIQENSSMQYLLEGNFNLDLPSQGEIRQGVVATIRENEILVSIGTKSEGIINGRELEQIPDDERSTLQVGQEIPVFVITPEDSNGNVVLSYVRAREEKDWDEVEALLESGTPYDSNVVGYNKGGLIVPVGRLRGFVPASQISLLRRVPAGENTEQRYAKMINEDITVRVIEVDRSRRRLILSERLALQETRETLKDRLLDELKEGDVRNGRVTSLADFGAFVNIDGADGLVHLSEISWERIQHPNEVLKVGEEVQVKVISVDQDRKRIGLSIRQLQEDPWLQKVGEVKEGMLVEGTITHLTKFGAFARVGEDLEGLIHVSELSELRISHPKEVVHEGEVVTLRVIKIDPERRRIGLSRRKVDSAAYADIDWKMALSDEVVKVQTEEDNTEEEISSLIPEDQESSQPLEVSETQDETISLDTPEDQESSQPLEASETQGETISLDTPESPVSETETFQNNE